MYSYSARSRFPLKKDVVIQDMLREFITQYFASKTSVEKAVLTVANMAAWIAAHHGQELGMTAQANTAEGIPVPAELRFAVNRKPSGSTIQNRIDLQW